MQDRRKSTRRAAISRGRGVDLVNQSIELMMIIGISYQHP
jgi:hypothetical protein